eukprot:7058057-Alexandrium_andersonii.AAC.1
MSASLVGSEMCIRDSQIPKPALARLLAASPEGLPPPPDAPDWRRRRAVSYTHLTLPTICSV